jgi:hypothetical protein
VIPINEDLRRRAEALTRMWGGVWNEATHKGRNAACPINGCGDAVSITPKAGKGILLVCNGNGCRAGLAYGDDSLITAARMAGIDCGPGNGRKPSGHRLWPASSDSITGLKRAERRVLKFVAAQTSTEDWFEVSKRTIASACRVSERDSVMYLGRLAARGLIRIRSNNYACKRCTQISFLVEPVDLCRRLVDAVNSVPENEPTPSENEPTMQHLQKMNPPPCQNEPTMKHPHVRIREVRGFDLELETGMADDL